MLNSRDIIGGKRTGRGGMLRGRGIFVTGTDTGVGKTLATAALVAALRAEGLNVGAWKPVQSGAAIGRGETDAERLASWTGLPERPEAVAPFTFPAPLCPRLAAESAGTELTMDAIAEAGLPLLERYDSLLIEGAGGVAVPLTKEELVIDLIVELDVPALIVARSGLGTINHTLLTASCLRMRGVKVLGVLLNDGCGPDADRDADPSVASNAELIACYGKLDVLGRLPAIRDAEMNGLDASKLAGIARRSVRLEPLRQALMSVNERAQRQG